MHRVRHPMAPRPPPPAPPAPALAAPHPLPGMGVPMAMYPDMGAMGMAGAAAGFGGGYMPMAPMVPHGFLLTQEQAMSMVFHAQHQQQQHSQQQLQQQQHGMWPYPH